MGECLSASQGLNFVSLVPQSHGAFASLAFVVRTGEQGRIKPVWFHFASLFPGASFRVVVVSEKQRGLDASARGRERLCRLARGI